MEIRGAVMKAVFQRPRTPRYRPLRRPESCAPSGLNQQENASPGAMPFGPEPPSSMMPDLPLVSPPTELMGKPSYLHRRDDSRHPVSASSLFTDSRNVSSTSATVSYIPSLKCFLMAEVSRD